MDRPDDRAPRVLLLREAGDDDAYEAALREAGYAPVSVPVLRFEFVNRKQLRDCLERPGAYAGLVLTSPRAVDALTDVMSWLPSENVRWHARPVFAVGPATADALRTIGFQPEGEDSGSAAMLAAYLARQTFDAPLLFLCGNRRRDVLPRQLEEAGILVEALCVYETHLRDDVDPVLFDTAQWIVFFSPSGVEALQRVPGETWRQARLAAIGPTTADALLAAGLTADAVAGVPAPEALVEAMRRHDLA